MEDQLALNNHVVRLLTTLLRLVVVLDQQLKQHTENKFNSNSIQKLYSYVNNVNEYIIVCICAYNNIIDGEVF